MLACGRMIQLIQVCLFILCPGIQPIKSRNPCILNCLEYKSNILQKKSTTMLVASTHVPAVKRAKFLTLEKLPDATGEYC